MEYVSCKCNAVNETSTIRHAHSQCVLCVDEQLHSAKFARPTLPKAAAARRRMRKMLGMHYFQWGMSCLGLVRRCKEGEHNDLATLFMSSSHHTIVKLFSMGHDPGEPYVTHFTQGSLALFVVVYIILMSVGAGVAIPGGLFMPSLIVSTSNVLVQPMRCNASAVTHTSHCEFDCGPPTSHSL